MNSINKRLSFTGVSSALSVLFVLQRILLKLGGQLTRTFILTAEINHPYVSTHFKRLSFTGVSSALSVLFVFPVQALTDSFNYSFRCLVETKVYIFSSRSYNTYSLKTSCYFSLLCFVT